MRRLGAARDAAERVCFNCEHWQGEYVNGEALNRILRAEDTYSDECRRFPPDAKHGWPLTGFMDHCGEWRLAACWRDAAKADGPAESLPQDLKGTIR